MVKGKRKKGESIGGKDKKNRSGEELGKNLIPKVGKIYIFLHSGELRDLQVELPLVGGPRGAQVGYSCRHGLPRVQGTT